MQNGNSESPKYKDVKADLQDHAETLEIQYDDNVISLSKILDLYFDIIDPVSVNQQGKILAFPIGQAFIIWMRPI